MSKYSMEQKISYLYFNTVRVGENLIPVGEYDSKFLTALG